jgi:hypothetical protein
MDEKYLKILELDNLNNTKRLNQYKKELGNKLKRSLENRKHKNSFGKVRKNDKKQLQWKN